MKDYLSHKESYHKIFADVMQKKYMQMRYGVKTCSVEYDMTLSVMRKDLADWQQNNDCDLENDSGNDNNFPPLLVYAGGSRTVYNQDLVIIQGEITAGANVTISSSAWTQIAGPTVSFTQISPSSISFTPTIVAEYKFRLTATDSNGTTASSVSVITVSASPAVVSWGYFTTDPTENVETKLLPFSKETIAGFSSIAMDFTSSSNDRFLVVKIPSGEQLMTNWFNTALNSGQIPDSVFKAPVIVNNYRYYVSRTIVTIDSTSSIITFSK